jgi:putative ATP-binding cassette transporter
MDEATAALDVDSQASMMELFRHELADSTVISVGHRPELEAFHTRKLSLRRSAVEDTGEREEGRRRKLGRLLRRTLRPRATPDPAHPPVSQ